MTRLFTEVLEKNECLLMRGGLVIYEAHHEKGFPTRSNTNMALLTQKMARGLKF